MAQARPMLRLLQGDVGSGKTLVALMALLIAVGGGGAGRRCWRRPRSSRASISRRLQRLLAGLAVRIAILTGRDKGRVREATLMGLADGRDRHPDRHACDLPGGGALSRPGAGGGRRAAPLRRGAADDAARPRRQVPPHLLVMTATPIPRTLPLADHGEMDVSRARRDAAGAQADRDDA